jgi:TonB family protein
MGMTKLQIAFAGLIVAGGTTGFLVQEKVNTALRAERTRLQAESTGVDGLREEARAIGRVAADVREWRKDDVELARLAEGAAILRKRLEKEARAKAAAVAAQSRLVDQKPVLKMSEVDQLPKMIGQRAVPKYPKDFRQAGLGGEAIIRFVVDARGQVRDVEVKRASHDAFADAAVAAVKTWVFEAAKNGNVPVNVQMAVPIVFTLDEADGRDRTWF